MRKIVFYDDTVNRHDIVKKFSIRAQENYGVSSIQQITSYLEANTAYDLVVISGHGMEGYQGVGSGTDAAFQPSTDFQGSHMAQQSLNEFLLLHTNQESNLKGHEKFTMRQLWRIGCSMKNGAVLFLAGCSVGAGREGQDLLKKTGLSIQNNIKVIAATCPIAMKKVGQKIIYTNADQNCQRLTENDLVGAQGERLLSTDELESICDKFEHNVV